ncbi:MAG: ammonium transporter [Chloroflexi bacterium]|nr:ammonium transporter [Chloroflexota bacterium]
MNIDLLWVTVSAGLVFLMQAGFLCLESGLTRNKNYINTAMSNLADFAVSTLLFWAFGYALMFGVSQSGWIGTSTFFVSYDRDGVDLLVFFIFQVMFCGAAITILSGAIAERMRFFSYIIISAVISGLVYPVFGHWVWNGIAVGEATGWLASMGFVDFAGSSVVHSVGGWGALAILLIVGPRLGRFPKDGPARRFSGADVPLAAVGVLLLWLGWFGFNGGSTLAYSENVIRIISNTVISGSAGLFSALFVGWLLRGKAEVDLAVNGSLVGLVAITANCHAVTTTGAALIGLIAGLIFLAIDALLIRFKIDDAVGAIPVHLGGGVWGTLAVALFGLPDLLGTGLSRPEQFGVQLLGVLVCGAWTFGVTYLILRIVNRIAPLRVSAEGEEVGLNVSEHGARTDLLDLFTVMDQQSKTGDLSLRVPIEPFTQVGQIGQHYNAVLEALEATVLRTESIVRSAMDGIVVFPRTSLEISAMNPAATAIFGYSADSLLGQPISVLLGQNQTDGSARGDTERLLQDLAQDDQYEEMTGYRADGSSFPMEVALTEARVGEDVFYTAMFRDITERIAARETMREAKEMAEKANRAKSLFLANVSHELRTPLNAIIGYSDLMLNGIYGDLSDGQHDRLSRINQNGQHLLSLINDVLDISKIEAGRMELYLERFNIGHLLQELASTVYPLMIRNNNTLDLQVPKDLGRINADMAKVRQAILNLLSNAAKFTENGTVTLSAKRSTQDGQDWITIIVKDNGIGMTPSQLERVFDEFMQADGSTSSKYGGTGLGLSISRRFCRMMGGDIDATSERGVGSTFSVRLPVEVPHTADTFQAPELPDSVVEAIREGAGTVLVIDDDADARELIITNLTLEGFEVLVAPTGKDGLRMAKDYQPDAITLDVMMPGMDGWAVLSALKEDPATADIPVIMLTMVGERNLGFTLGASEYLTKPVDSRRLISVLRRYHPRGFVSEDDAIGIAMVIDDDPSVRQMMRDTLSSESWMVYEAEHGQDGIDQLAQIQPDVIILDLMMPVMDGFEFLEAVRSQVTWQDVPIIVITAKDLNLQDRNRLNGYVQRTLNKGTTSSQDLLDDLRSLVRRRLRP